MEKVSPGASAAPPSASPAGVFAIPTEGEAIADFVARVAALIRDPATHLYIDTSFLMWMTKIGKTSRQQLTTWLEANCTSRVHVPVWSAHEYLRHHAENTIVDEVRRKSKELKTIARTAFAYFRPFLDDQSPSFGSAETRQNAAREAIRSLQALADNANDWPDSYQEHAGEVIAFINAHAPASTGVFSYMADIDVIANSRFSGRVPPGFQDRNKKEIQQNAVDPDAFVATIGDNRWGDLLFWRELLDHAKSVKASVAIILSNDRKSDWYVRDGATEQPQKFAPRPQPMLSLEAKLAAGINELVLLDSQRLGRLVDKTAGPEAASLIAVAVVPDLPRLDAEKEWRRDVVAARVSADAQKQRDEAQKLSVRFIDRDGLSFGGPALLRAILESRSDKPRPPGAVGLLEHIQDAVSSAISAADVLTEENLRELSHIELVAAARAVHDRAVAGDQGLGAAVSDIAGTLSELPKKTAGCLYFGLVASMYLEPTSNKLRFPPQSPAARQIFQLQSSPLAAEPIAALNKHLEGREVLPLYQLRSSLDEIEVALTIEPDGPHGAELRSLKIADQEILTAVQGKPSLNISKLTGEEMPLGEIIIAHVCEALALPFDQMRRTDDFGRRFRVSPQLGIKDPQYIYIDKGDSAK